MISLAQAPSELSKYELIDEIGHGGMATVFRARDKRLGREVALKLLHRHLRESVEIEARFSGEARAVAKLRHPNIVAVFDVSDEDEPERYLVMELVRGVTLRQLLKQRGCLPVELAAAMVLEIAAALEHAHTEGVIHRDIKPENVLIDSSDSEPRSSEDSVPARVKLTDFGIAKLLDVQGVTSTGQVLGSPAHMAPEQIEGRPVDVRADVFSLGVLFYECVVGKLPFEGRNPAQVLRNVLEGNFEAPDRAQPKVGARFGRIIERALQREPTSRYASIAAFGKEVKEELERVGMGATRHEIASFLKDMDAYGEAFDERIVAALRKSGIEARQNRLVPIASAQFNRALAYRPGDKELLRQVSGMRWRTGVLRAVVAVVGVGAVALTASLALRGPEPSESDALKLDPSPTTTGVQATAQPSASAPVVPAPTVDRGTATALDAPVATSTPRRPPLRGVIGEGARPVATGATPGASVTAGSAAPGETASPDVPPPDTGETRGVSVRLAGAVGGSVKIDGKERPWFGGVVHDLTLGDHVFEFVPPNDTCCVGSSQKIRVVSGPGVQQVFGRIPFKDATLDMRSGNEEGWSVSCPTLFSGAMALPGIRSVPMSQVEARGSCVLTHRAEGSSTRRKIVTLAAGQTTILSWP